MAGRSDGRPDDRDAADGIDASNYDDHAQLFAVIVAVPSTVGELSFAVWLLSRGGKRQERDQVAAAVAR